tara:strand:+ start:322 stop:810 length:489 start_codon:yes stop_codon:yes gene_type:complete
MIYIIRDIFTKEERLQLLDEVEPLLVDGDQLSLLHYGERGRYPGKQSHPTFHLHPDFKGVHDRFVDAIKQTINMKVDTLQSWINWSDGSHDTNWHTHPAEWCGVYYLKTFPFLNSGTQFEDKFVRAPQNSLLFFPCNLKHSAPNSFVRYNRYTIAVLYDLIK